MDASIIKDALDFSAKQAQPVIKDVGRAVFAVWPNGISEELIPAPRPPRPDTLPLTSLDALVMMVREEAVPRGAPVGSDTKLFITVPDHRTARCFGLANMADDGFRPVLYEAEAKDVPGLDKAEYGFEAAQIALRTMFQRTDDVDYCLTLLSQISTGAKVTYNDNGIATSIVTQKGVALQQNQVIRPIVTLKPYRTFQEVEQPASEFHIRIRERGIAFIESDGGMWKLAARQTVKAYLCAALEAEIEAGTVCVAL